MIFRKLLVIIMGIFLVICAGAANIYPLYLKRMRDKFGFSLKEVNLYGTFINMGGWIALPMGYIYDNFGPKISCVIGTILLSGSYLTLHFIFNSDSTEVSIVIFLIIGVLMGQGSALCYTTSVTTNLKNFRFKESSAIVGLLVANFALSPSVFTTYRQAMKDMRTNIYFLIIAIFIFAVITICTFVFHNIRRVYNEDENKKTYEKYKETKIVKFLIYLNIFILIIYTFGVIFNSIWEGDNQSSKFPLIIIYPALQLLNFLVIILEKFGVFDGMFFKPFIDKLIIQKMNERMEIGSNRNRERVGNEEEMKEIEGNLEGDKEKVDDSSKKNPLESENDFTEVNLTNDNASNEVSVNDSGVNLVLGVKDDKRESMLRKDKEERADNNSVGNISELAGDNNSPVSSNSNKLVSGVQDPDNIDISFKDAVLSKHVLMLFAILTLGVGSLISNLNNIEFIILSVTQKGHTNSNTQTTNPSSNLTPSTLEPIPEAPNDVNKSNIIYSYVILYFVFNSFTRIISGLLLDRLITSKKLFHFLVIITICGLISQFLGIFMSPSLLLLAISLAGACHGGYMTFIPVFVRNEYGLKHMGKILGFLTSGNALGALIIADLLFILPYNINLNSKGECFGAKCFTASYVLTTLFFCVNLALSIILLKDYIAKVKSDEEEQEKRLKDIKEKVKGIQ